MLTPDQIEGAEFLAARRVAMLADKAGFGKSAQFVRAADMLGAETITILCPPILRPTEISEYQKWSVYGEPVHIIRKGTDDVPAKGVVACSYKLAAENPRIKKLLIKRKPDVLILDEAHYLKDPTSGRSRAVLLKDGIASTAKVVWFVTATPTPNNASEFFPLAKACGAWPGSRNDFIKSFCAILDPPAPEDANGWFKYALSVGSWKADYATFMAAFFTTENGVAKPKSVGKLRALQRDKIVGSKNEEQLKAMLSPYVLARNKIDKNRPPLTVDAIQVDGDRPDFSGVPVDVMEMIDDAISAGTWQALDGPAVATVRRVIGVAKSKAVAELAAVALEGGEGKMLIFCEHTLVINAIKEKLGGCAAVIDGNTPQKVRGSITAPDGLFQTTPWPKVLICQRMALKEGVTLTAADRVLLAEPPWTPDDCEQMIARAWRRGQTKPVRASYVYLQDSFDARISATLARKTADLAKISMSTTR
jgi:SWI/SNF-related matrix-associated actin-dependent regulator of chromatin subfamily A-like protein 1